jgi:hypothetical protein
MCMLVPDKRAAVSGGIKTRLAGRDPESVFEIIVGTGRAKHALREETRRRFKSAQIAGMLTVAHCHCTVILGAAGH